jgi:hypothetical protein
MLCFSFDGLSACVFSSQADYNTRGENMLLDFRSCKNSEPMVFYAIVVQDFGGAESGKGVSEWRKRYECHV